MKHLTSRLWAHFGLWIFYLAIIPCLFVIAYVTHASYGINQFAIDAFALLIGAYLGYIQAQIKYKLLAENKSSIILRYILLIITYCITFGLPVLYTVLIHRNYIPFLVGWYVLFLIVYIKFYKGYALNYIELTSWEICIIAAFT